MNLDKIREWSESSPEAAAMYAYLASRKRSTRGGKPSDLRHIVMRLVELGFTLTPRQVEIELSKLQALGVGTLEHRPNRRPKWRWTDSPTAVAKMLNPKTRLVQAPVSVYNSQSVTSERHVIRITRGDTMIEADPEDLAKVLMAIGMG